MLLFPAQGSGIGCHSLHLLEAEDGTGDLLIRSCHAEPKDDDCVTAATRLARAVAFALGTHLCGTLQSSQYAP